MLLFLKYSQRDSCIVDIPYEQIKKSAASESFLLGHIYAYV